MLCQPRRPSPISLVQPVLSMQSCCCSAVLLAAGAEERRPGDAAGPAQRVRVRAAIRRPGGPLDHVRIVWPRKEVRPCAGVLSEAQRSSQHSGSPLSWRRVKHGTGATALQRMAYLRSGHRAGRASSQMQFAGPAGLCATRSWAGLHQVVLRSLCSMYSLQCSNRLEGAASTAVGRVDLCDVLYGLPESVLSRWTVSDRPPGGVLANYWACVPRANGHSRHVKTIVNTHHAIKMIECAVVSVLLASMML